MKYSIPRQIEPEFESDGIVFFAQRLEEMLSNCSDDLYKMPLLNTHSLASEYCKVAKMVDEGVLKEQYRTEVYNEFVHSFGSDIVLKENWGLENVERVTKSFGSCNQKKKNNVIAYIDATLDSKYLDWTKQTILKYTGCYKEKKKIEAALRCFLPELIMWGYDPEFIHTTLDKYFFKGTTLNSRTVEDFLNIFNLKYYNYKVYFSVSASVQNFREILEKRLNVCFEDDGNFSSFKCPSNKIIVYFENVRECCPNSAAKRAYGYLDMFFSFYKYVGNKKSLSMQNKAMVIKDDERPVFVGAKRQAFTVIEQKNYAEIGVQTDTLITGVLSNAMNEYLMISKAIDLHNTALSVADLKSGFLNLWSSLEVLAQDQDASNKLGPVLDLVIPILKKDYIVKRITELNRALKDNLSEKDYQYIYDQIDGEGCEKKKTFQLVYLDRYSSLREELFEKLSAIPLVRSRICMLSSANTTKKLNAEVTAYTQRVKWHMYRMYRTRNAIAHSGDDPDNLKYLGEHLHSYLDATANELIVKLSGEIPFCTREDIITDLSFAIARLDSCLEKDVPIDEEVINLLIHPEIGYVMHCGQHKKE